MCKKLLYNREKCGVEVARFRPSGNYVLHIEYCEKIKISSDFFLICSCRVYSRNSCSSRSQFIRTILYQFSTTNGYGSIKGENSASLYAFSYAQNVFSFTG